jgi:hypothetical protein
VADNSTSNLAIVACENGLIQSLHNKASTLCQEQYLFDEISSLRSDLQPNGYPQGFIDSVINSKRSNSPNKEEKPLVSVYVPCVMGISEKFKRIGNRYNIRIIFNRSSLMKSMPERDPQQTAQYIYSIPCECGRSYIGERGRPLILWLREHRYSVRVSLLEKPKLGQHAYEEGHRVGWD